MSLRRLELQSADRAAAHILRQEEIVILDHTPTSTSIYFGKFMLDRFKPADLRPEPPKKATKETTPVLELSREEIIQRIDHGAQRRRRMSGQELIRAYRAGRLEDPGAVADLLALADLLPEDDELFAES